jgi:hypothetical protein
MERGDGKHPAAYKNADRIQKLIKGAESHPEELHTESIPLTEKLLEVHRRAARLQSWSEKRWRISRFL